MPPEPLLPPLESLPAAGLDPALAALLDAVAVPLVVYDALGQIEWLNWAAAEFYGVGALGTPAYAHARRLFFRAPDGSELPPHDLPVARALRGEVLRAQPYRLTDRYGRDLPVLFSIAPLYDAERVVRLVAVWQVLPNP